jgi:hypothetical protein
MGAFAESFEAPPNEATQMSALSAALRHAGLGILPTVGAAAGATALTALAPVSAPATVPFLLGLAGSIGGGMAIGAGQNKLLQAYAPQVLEQAAAAEEQHPYASMGGRLASGLAGFRAAPGALIKNAISLTRPAGGTAAVPAEAAAFLRRQAAKQLGGQVGLGAGMGIGMPLVQGQTPTLRDVGESVLMAALFGSSRFDRPGVMPTEPQPPTVPPSNLHNTLSGVESMVQRRPTMAPVPPERQIPQFLAPIQMPETTAGPRLSDVLGQVEGQLGGPRAPGDAMRTLASREHALAREAYAQGDIQNGEAHTIEAFRYEESLRRQEAARSKARELPTAPIGEPLVEPRPTMYTSRAGVTVPAGAEGQGQPVLPLEIGMPKAPLQLTGGHVAGSSPGSENRFMPPGMGAPTENVPTDVPALASGYVPAGEVLPRYSGPTVNAKGEWVEPGKPAIRVTKPPATEPTVATEAAAPSTEGAKPPESVVLLPNQTKGKAGNPTGANTSLVERDPDIAAGYVELKPENAMKAYLQRQGRSGEGISPERVSQTKTGLHRILKWYEAEWKPQRAADPNAPIDVSIKAYLNRVAKADGLGAADGIIRAGKLLAEGLSDSPYIDPHTKQKVVPEASELKTVLEAFGRQQRYVVKGAKEAKHGSPLPKEKVLKLADTALSTHEEVPVRNTIHQMLAIASSGNVRIKDVFNLTKEAFTKTPGHIDYTTGKTGSNEKPEIDAMVLEAVKRYIKLTGRDWDTMQDSDRIFVGSKVDSMKYALLGMAKKHGYVPKDVRTTVGSVEGARKQLSVDISEKLGNKPKTTQDSYVLPEIAELKAKQDAVYNRLTEQSTASVIADRFLRSTEKLEQLVPNKGGNQPGALTPEKQANLQAALLAKREAAKTQEPGGINIKLGENPKGGFQYLAWAKPIQPALQRAGDIARQTFASTKNAARAVVAGLRHLKEVLGEKFAQYSSQARAWLNSLFTKPEGTGETTPVGYGINAKAGLGKTIRDEAGAALPLGHEGRNFAMVRPIIGQKRAWLDKPGLKVLSELVKGKNRVIDAFSGSGVMGRAVKSLGFKGELVENEVSPRVSAALKKIKSSEEKLNEAVELGLRLARTKSPKEFKRIVAAHPDQDIALFVGSQANLRRRSLEKSETLVPDPQEYNQLRTLGTRLRIWRESSGTLRSEDGFALTATAGKGDLVIVDPPYVGTDTYRQNLQKNGLNEVSLALNRGADVLYFNKFSLELEAQARRLGLKTSRETIGGTDTLIAYSTSKGIGIAKAIKGRGESEAGAINPKGNEKRLTPVDKTVADKVEKLAMEGKTAEPIAKALGITPEAVRQVREERGIPKRYTQEKAFATWQAEKSGGATTVKGRKEAITRTTPNDSMREWAKATDTPLNPEEMAGMRRGEAEIQAEIPTLKGVNKAETRTTPTPLPHQRVDMTKPEQVVSNFREWAKVRFDDVYNRVYNKLDKMVMPIDAMMDWMDGGNAKFNGFIHTNIRKPLNVAANLESRAYQKWHQSVIDLANKHKIDKSRGIAMGIEMIARQPTGPERLEASGISKAVQEAYRKTITPQEREVMAAMSKVYKELAPHIDRVLRNEYGHQLTLLDNYFPFLRDWKLYKTTPEFTDIRLKAEMKPDDVGNLMKEFGFQSTGTKVEQGFTIDRVGDKASPIKVNAFDVFQRSVRDMTHFISQQELLRSRARIVRSDEFREKYGDVGQQLVMDWLNTMATQSRNAPRAFWLDSLRNNTSVGVIAFRLASQLVHTSNIPFAIMHLNRMTKNPSEAMGLWWDGLQDAASNPATKKWLDKYARETFERGGGEITINDAAQSELTKSGRVSKWGFYVMRQIDMLNAQATTLAAYKAKLAQKGKDPARYLEQPVDHDALQDALTIARRAVASPLYKDAPLILSRGGSIQRTIFQFQNTFLDQFSNLRLEIGSAGVKEAKQGNPKLLASGMIAAATMIVLESAIKLETKHMWQGVTGYKPEKEEGKEYAEFMMHEAVRRIPFMGQAMIMMNTIKRATAGEQLDVRSGIPVADVLIGGAQKAYELYSTDKRTKPLAGTQAMISGLEAMGIPGMAQVGEIAGNVLKAGLKEQGAREIAKRGGVDDVRKLTLWQRGALSRQQRIEDEPKTAKERQQEQIRGARAQFRRQEEVMTKLPKADSDWIKQQKLVPAGYQGTLSVGGNSVVLTSDERREYAKLIVEATVKAVAALRGNVSFDKLPPGLKAKRWRYVERQMHAQAERRLMGAIQSGSIIGPD